MLWNDSGPPGPGLAKIDNICLLNRMFAGATVKQDLGKQADNIISSLYGAAAGESKWQGVMSDLAEATRSRGADVLVKKFNEQLPEEIISFGLSPDSKKLYQEYYFSVDTVIHQLMSASPGICRGCHVALTDADVRKSEYFQDFSLPDGLRYRGGGFQFDEERIFVLAAHRAPRQRIFEDDVLALMQRVLHHLPHVFRLRDVFQKRQEDTAWLSAAIDHMPHPVVVADVCGHIRYMSPACDRLGNQQCSFVVRNGKIGLTDPVAHSRLLGLIKMACNVPASLPPAFLPITGSDGRTNLEITVTPLRPEQNIVAREGDALAMLILRTPFAPFHANGVSERPYGLSHAELAVAAALVEGISPEEYAANRDIKISTVRTQIRSILDKTGTRNTVEMVSLFAGMQIPQRKA